MDCPVCKKIMTDENLGGVQVQVCESGCKGLWFDCGELAKLDESNEGIGQALKHALAAPRVNDSNRADLDCPECNISMHHHLYKSEKEVSIDECYKCGGIFVDSGELKVIRDNHMSEVEESAYLQKLLDDLPAYEKGVSDQGKAEQRNDSLRHFTRFLRVSYYVTGK